MLRIPTAHRLALVSLALAMVVAYAGSLGGAFVFDDVPAIVENPTIRQPGHLGALLAPPGDQAGTVGGRPVVNLSLALNYAIGGTAPRGYHVFNLAVHVGAALLLFGVIRRTLDLQAGRGSRPWPAAGRLGVAWAAALLWALHPLQTEAVTYVVQRAESLMGLFYLATVYCFIRSVEVGSAFAKASADEEAGGAVWAWLAVLCCLLGMGTKEVMVSAPVVLLLYDRTFVAGSLREAWRRRRGTYLALAATWLPLAALVAGTGGRGGSAGFGSQAGVWPYLLTQVRAVATYLRLAFWPTPLVFDYGTALVQRPAEVIGSILVLAPLAAATIHGLWRRTGAGFLGACFFGILAPSSSLVPIATEPMAEHRMYLPLAAVVVLVVAGLYRVLDRLAPGRAVAALGGLAGAAGLALGGATADRNRDYRSEVALWSDTVRKAPGNARAHNDLGMALGAQGQGARAAAEFAAAVAADPNYAPGQYNLGATLLDAGRPAEALPHLERAAGASRHQAERQLYLGQALCQLGRFAEAVPPLREAVRLAPQDADAVFTLGNALAAAGRYGEAVAAFRRAVALVPGRVRPRNNLANALMCAGRLDEAVAEYRAALRLQPEDAAIRSNLDLALRLRDEGGPASTGTKP